MLRTKTNDRERNDIKHKNKEGEYNGKGQNDTATNIATQQQDDSTLHPTYKGDGTNQHTNAKAHEIIRDNDNTTKDSGADEGAAAIATSIKKMSNVEVGGVVATKIQAPSLNQLLERRNDSDHVIASRQLQYTEQFKSQSSTVTYHELFNGLNTNQRIRPLNNQFVLVTNPIPYLKYKAKVVDTYARGGQFDTTLPYTHIITPTLETFKYGTAFTTLDINEDYFGQYSINTARGLPLSNGMLLNIGVTPGMNESNEFVAGLLMTLFGIMRDNRICRVDETNMIFNNLLPQDLANFLQPPYQQNVGVNPGILQYECQVDWLRADVLENLNDGRARYIVGKVSVQLDPRIRVKKVESYAINIDHFSASILNLNMQKLLDSHGSVADRVNELKAHAFIGSSIFAPEVGDLRPELPFDTDHVIRMLMLAGARYPRLGSLILKINVDYFESTNFIRVTAAKEYLPRILESNIQAQKLREVLATRIADADLAFIKVAFAREVTPFYTVRHLVNINNDFSHPVDIIVIMELILFSWIFPTTFDSIKGEVQNVLFRFFKVWYSTETATFLQQYGTTYVINGNVKVFSGRNELWSQSNYLSNIFPALFSGEQFTTRTILRVMNLFRPKGFLRRDDLAIAAKFPRQHKNPQHYIPFSPQLGQVSNDFTQSANGMISELMKLASEKATADEAQRAARSALGIWFNFMKTKLGRMADAYTDHYSRIITTMSNFMLNYTSDFNGSFSTNKLHNYAIVSTNSTIVPIIENIGEVEGGASYVDTAVIWPLIGQATYPLLRVNGGGVDSVPIDEAIVFPSPDESYNESLSVIETIQDIVAPDVFMSYILSALDSVNAIIYHYDIDQVIVVTNQNVDMFVMPRLHMLYGPNFQIPVVTAQTTLYELIQMTELHNIVRVGNDGFTIDQLDYIIEHRTIVVGVNNFVQGEATLIERAPILLSSFIYDQRLPTGPIDIGRLLRIMPKMSNAQARVAYDFLSKVVAKNIDEYASMILRFLGPMKYELLLVCPQIRRVDAFGGVSHFDENIDIEAFRWSNWFLKDIEYDRLRIGSRLLFNEKIYRMFSGLRLVKIEELASDPDFVPSTDDFRRIVYRHDLFIQVREQGRKLVAFVDPDTEMIYPRYDNRPQMIHLIIESRYGIDPAVIDNILGSINECKWMVDLKDVHYTAEMTTPTEHLENKYTLESLMRLPPGMLPHIYFLDSALAIEDSTFQRPQFGRAYRIAYPLNEISIARTTRALVTEAGPPRPIAAVPPHYTEYDTGTIGPQGQLLYTNQDDKLDRDYVSMSNIVNMFTSNVKLDEELEVEYAKPHDLRSIPIVN
nr:MAG: putative major capsid protein [Cypovirus sp.]